MHLNTDEWLYLAKSISVGSQARFRHGAENRRNLVVYNNHDTWSCWCHSCQAGGSVKKDVVNLAAMAEEKPKHPIWNPKLVPLAKSDKLREVAKFLNSKGMSVMYLPNPLWDTERHRIVLEFPEQRVGRTIRNDGAKWLKYSGEADYVELVGGESKSYILVEDLFSALKVRYVLGTRFNVVALMGTKLDGELQAFFRDNDVKVYTMLDGDTAGRKGAFNIKRRLSLLGRGVVDVAIPDGKDPKDLSLDEIRNYYAIEQVEA